MPTRMGCTEPRRRRLRVRRRRAEEGILGPKAGPRPGVLAFSLSGALQLVGPGWPPPRELPALGGADGNASGFSPAWASGEPGGW